MSISQILVGSDPEIFVKKDGVFICAHDLIPGTKESPFKVDKGAVQVDGFALEFNIDPARNADEFVGNHETVLAILAKMVPGYELATVPVADFTREYMDACPAEAKILGCDPDYDAWTGLENIKPQADLPMRTASGHVHIGWASGLADHHDHCRAAAIQMDFFLGLPSLFYDSDTRRRSMYGKAGCYRPKSYGVEYRTLSNAWLLSRERMTWVYNQVQKGMRDLMDGASMFERYGDISSIINESNKDEARRILKDANIAMI